MGVLPPLRENTGCPSSAATGMSSVIDQFSKKRRRLNPQTAPGRPGTGGAGLAEAQAPLASTRNTGQRKEV